MAKDKEIKHQKTKHIDVEDLWMLPGVRNVEIGKIRHDTTSGWIYVRLRERLKAFGTEVSVGTGLQADNQFDIGNLTFYGEVDLGNMEPDRIHEKMDLYIRYAKFPKKTLFFLADGKYTAEATGTAILEYADRHKRGSQFLITDLRQFYENPWGECLYSPIDGAVSFDSLNG